jgi:hypothetical protein
MRTAHKNNDALLFCAYLACVFISVIGLGVWKLGLIPKTGLLYTVPVDVVVMCLLYCSATRNRR